MSNNLDIFKNISLKSSIKFGNNLDITEKNFQKIISIDFSYHVVAKKVF